MSPDYFEKVAPEPFEFIESDVKSRFNSKFPEWVLLSCGLHFLVSNGTDYFLSGASIPDPTDMVDKLEGDCQDQSVLLASLYIASGLEPRFVAISDRYGKKPHVLTEVHCSVPDTETTYSVIEKFYDEELDMMTETISWESTNQKGYWYVADPEFSRYIGDIESLKQDDYIRDTGSEWEWYNCRDIQSLR